MAETENSGKSIRIITRVLTRAAKFWLRSQVSSIGSLEIDFNTNDRQLLSGSISGVSIVASQAVYQGIHIGHVKLTAKNIITNLSAVLRGKALKLLEPLQVDGDAIFTAEGISSSISSEMLLPVLHEVLFKFLPEDYSKTKSIVCKSVQLRTQQMTIMTIYDPELSAIPLEFDLGLELVGKNALKLQIIQVTSAGQVITTKESGEVLNLGSDVEFERLAIQPGKVSCQGRIKVNP